MVEPATVVKVPPLVPVVIIPKPAFKVPAPVNTILALVPVPSVVISPVTETVPVEIVSLCETVVPELVNAILPAFKVPEPTSTKFKFGAVLSALGMVNAPEMVKVYPASEIVEFEVAPLVKVIDVHAAFAVSVIIAPDAIVTLSPVVGTTPPNQVEVLFQFPVTAFEVIFAASTLFINNKANKTTVIYLNNTFIQLMFNV